MKIRLIISILAAVLSSISMDAASNKAWTAGDFITCSPSKSSFCLSSPSGSSRILVDAGDWARDKFARPDQKNGINADMYAHMFELILRLNSRTLSPSV